MHRADLFGSYVSAKHNFVLTLSVDGVLKFWKKTGTGLEFVKQFTAHAGAVAGAALNADGTLFATVGGGAGAATAKVFDVANFDMINLVTLPYAPGCVCWLQQSGQAQALLAVSDAASPAVAVYDVRSDDAETPVTTVADLHRQPLAVLAYNAAHGCAVSVDTAGMVEYWRPAPGSADGYEVQPGDVFQYKSKTDLYEFRKRKCTPTCLTFDPRGRHFATYSVPDRQVRLFDFASGKIVRTYDESIAVANDMQQAGTAPKVFDEIEFGRRMAVEREIDREPAARARINVAFDESGHFVVYGSYLGVKIINTVTNRCVRVLGTDEPFRVLHVALYQGAPNRKDLLTLEMAASDNALVSESLQTDPTLVAVAHARARFFLFSNHAGDFAALKADRDVYNEKPTISDRKAARELSEADEARRRAAALATGVTMHTSLGDVQLRLYPQQAPLAVENFVTLCRRGYYNGTIFHRVIKNFMVQAGDPLGDGTGGESMWGSHFKDEFSPDLRHDRPFTLSMANAGPNTNGSQFFITTEATQWLDDKHTVFGRVVSGMDVVKSIEGLPTDRYDKPEDPPTIVSTTVL
ncbi:uncharacterized protein V1510DRAFT_415134 [Dipodascopsis tothii]|uniref:uncharacterized protein n=1 Tax=Dipodascopsis tothii TaxID=44089 RepID=UPI0034CFCB57